MRKRTVLSIVLLAAGMVACSHPAKENSVPVEKQTVITYLTSGKEDEGSTRIIKELSAEYESKNPQVKFNIENVADTDLSQRVQLLAASNDLPVLFSYQSGKPLLDLINSGAVLNLEETLSDLGLIDHLNQTAVQLLKNNVSGAGLYALPLELNIEGFWYNKKIFAKYGLTPPRTWEELLTVAKRLKQEGIQAFSVAGKEKWPITRLINAYAIRKLGADAMERVDQGTLSLTDPGFLEAAETVQSMGLNGYFGAWVNSIDMDTSVKMFLEGKAAMFYMGSWQLRAFNDPARNEIGMDQIGFFSIPLVRDGVGSLEDYPVNAGLTTSFSKASYNAEVGKWMKYVFEGYSQKAMSELGIVTGFRLNAMPENVPELTKLVQDRIDHVRKSALWFEARFNTRATLLAWDNAQMLVTDSSYKPMQYLQDLQKVLDENKH